MNTSPIHFTDSLNYLVMALVSASLLAANPLNLQAEVNRVLDAGADWLHLDIMDQHYVPNLSFGPHVCQALRDQFPKAVLDVHLMVDRVDEVSRAFAQAGADILTIHPSATTHLHRSLQVIKSLGVSASVVLNPAEPLSTLDWCDGMVDMVLLMSVNPGFGGQSNLPFIVDKTEKLAALMQTWKQPAKIQLDGGINAQNHQLYSQAGADVLVMGSALFNAEDPAGLVQSVHG